MKNNKHKRNLDELEKMLPTEEVLQKYGCTTTWEIQKEFEIDKQKTSRAIRANKLNAFMKKVIDKTGKEGFKERWYIIKDDKYYEFIKDNKK